MPLDIPGRIKPFIELGFGVERQAGDEFVGVCPFCLKDRFYVNGITGQWDCKAGACQRHGSSYQFLSQIIDSYYESYNSTAPWADLAKEKSIPEEALRDSELAWDGFRWCYPAYRPDGKCVNIYRYTKIPGKKATFMGLPDCIRWMFGMADLEYDGTVHVCEGPWDMIMLRHHTEEPVIAVPGAGWKDEWTEALGRRDVLLCFDAGKPGELMTRRAIEALNEAVGTLRVVAWPTKYTNGYDVKDHFVGGGSLEEMYGYIVPAAEFTSAPPPVQLVEFGSEEHTGFDKVLEVHKKWLHVTKGIEDALRVAYATVLSNQIPGEMLWMYIVGPPGSTKTEILRPLEGSHSTYFASSVTEASLISGFKMPNGVDPSLIPKLDGKTFIFKDWTELLSLPAQQLTAITGILRGGYDGYCSRPFGNGMVRAYKSRFTILSAVTPEIYKQSDASMGERFLNFHGIKGDLDEESIEVTRRALSIAKTKEQMRDEINAVSVDFLNCKLSPDDIPALTPAVEERLVQLAHVTALLRARVEKNPRNDKHLYPAQIEYPTRIVQQFWKLAVSLTLLEPTRRVTDRVLRIVTQVAYDSCTPFHLNVARLVMEAGDWMSYESLCDKTRIPYTTLLEQIDDLRTQRAVKTEHRKIVASDRLKAFWYAAGLPNGRKEITGTVTPFRVRIKQVENKTA